MVKIMKQQHSNIKLNRLSPILKWAGGKEQELKYIHPQLPEKINNYYEPFIGGGAVYFSISANKMFINDKSHELIGLYHAISNQDEIFFKIINEVIHNWTLLEQIIQSNKNIFIKNYIDYSNNYLDEKQVEDWVYEFALKHNKEFNGMFDTSFNVNIENFLKEIKKNIVNKMKRMKKIELERGKLPENDILDNMEEPVN